jgi:hypothetical protein
MPNARPAHSTTGLPTSNDLPRHPSLDFKKLACQGERFSIRVGDHYRALGHKINDGYEWVWIGTHEDYSKLLG